MMSGWLWWSKPSSLVNNNIAGCHGYVNIFTEDLTWCFPKVTSANYLSTELPTAVENCFPQTPNSKIACVHNVIDFMINWMIG